MLLPESGLSLADTSIIDDNKLKRLKDMQENHMYLKALFSYVTAW